MAEPNHAGDVQAALAFAKDHVHAYPLGLQNGSTETAQVVVVPRGLELKSTKPFVDEWRGAPERRAGQATLQDLDSFIALTLRFRDDGSALFADTTPEAPGLTAVFDYHQAGPEGAARFGRHGAVYPFPLSDEWKAWAEKDEEKMNQAEFAEFLEDRIGDVPPPPVFTDESADADRVTQLGRLLGGTFASAQRLLELSRGLKVVENARVKSAVNLSTGEAQIAYESDHRDDAGAPLKVPNLFLIGVPVFRGGALYRVGVRLRYRVVGGSISWLYQLYRADVVLADAVTEACGRAQSQTGLPLYKGLPEKAA
ncbi:uncharacterized protein YfdQ (DUF2303 family) [Stella humosa]|uniref:Uncharacterized protein YfdQ (DUF2303 family) n=1 Tax=Stella humosa TaxID=94 RepID=A0A3N1M415_9PROT|nr:DUF2303 family protein [Stella humosa]ROQ00482.1 uncharacterized protein YfdQ (DUF2303 family) [Stella humosa]BBK30273.1 hypothetical protein STHU_09070 [Stella humosa]